VSTLLFFHNGLFRAGLLLAAIIAIWGFFMFFRRMTPTASFRSVLVLTEGLFIVQGLLGVTIFLSGGHPRDPLHWLYGVLLVIVLPVAATYTSNLEDRRQSLVYGVAGLFMVGLAIRAVTTS
jgi:heme A synthase